MEFQDTSEITLTHRLGSLLTRDLLGRKPSKFVASLDAFNQELINHLSSPAHYPQIGQDSNYWDNQGNSSVALALERWLNQIRPNGLVDVQLQGFTERGYKRIRRFATRVEEAGHVRYLDGTGVYSEADFFSRLRQALQLVDVQTIPNPHKRSDFIQNQPDAREALPIFRFLLGMYPYMKVRGYLKLETEYRADFQLPAHLYHCTREASLASIKTVGILASSCGRHHDRRAYGTPSQGIFLGTASIPGELPGEMPDVFYTDESSAWVVIQIPTSTLNPQNLRPDPASYEEFLRHPAVSSAGRFARFMGESPRHKPTIALYDKIMKGGRHGFADNARSLWQWSAMHGGSIFYAGNIHRSVAADFRFHPRSSALLANRRAAERLASFESCTQHYRTFNDAPTVERVSA